MKVRTIFLAMLIVAALVSTGSMTVFASSGVNQIDDVVSESSSGELLESSTNNLKDMAIGIRDSLDTQMDSQREKVQTWAKSPIFQEIAKTAQGCSLEDLYEMWSAEDGRSYDDGEAVGDGDPKNDLSPAASYYLQDLVDSTLFSEIFVTDSRGYVIAASGPTSDFDQGPDDWRVYLQDGIPVYKQHDPTEKGEDWYASTYDSIVGTYVGEVSMDTSSNTWGMDIVCKIVDRETSEYLGQIKAVFDYGTFIDDFVSTNSLGIWEIKVLEQDGDIVATSMIDKTKVNNEETNQAGMEYFAGIAAGSKTGSSDVAEIDENEAEVYYGYAVSNDINKHVVVVSKKAYAVTAPINAYVNGVQTAISDKGSDIQRNMWIIGCAVAVLIVTAAFFIIRAKVSNPLNKLTAVSNKLSLGEIEGLELDVHGKDEIGSLGESFQGVLAAFNLLKEQAEEKKETREPVVR